MDTRPHILHVIDSLAAGGSERMAIEIANATDEKRYRASICVTRQDLTLAAMREAQVDLFHLNRQRSFDWRKFGEFNAYCTREQVQLLHAHGWFSFLLVAFISMVYPRLRKTPILLHDHYGDVEIKPRFPLTVRAALLIRRPFYVGVHEMLTELAVRYGLDSRRAFTIPNAIDFKLYQDNRTTYQGGEWQIGCQGPFGVMVANMRKSKDIQMLLRALSQIKEAEWTVALVGDLVEPSYVQACHALRQELGLQERVLFLGKRMDVGEILHQVDFGMLTSLTESGPLALIEYAAAGLPFAATCVGSISRLLAAKGVEGFVDAGDAAGMAHKVRDLLQLSEKGRKNRGEHGRQIAARYFDIQAVMPAWYAVYEAALKERQ